MVFSARCLGMALLSSLRGVRLSCYDLIFAVLLYLWLAAGRRSFFAGIDAKPTNGTRGALGGWF